MRIVVCCFVLLLPCCALAQTGPAPSTFRCPPLPDLTSEQSASLSAVAEQRFDGQPPFYAYGSATGARVVDPGPDADAVVVCEYSAWVHIEHLLPAAIPAGAASQCEAASDDTLRCGAATVRCPSGITLRGVSRALPVPLTTAPIGAAARVDNGWKAYTSATHPSFRNSLGVKATCVHGGVSAFAEMPTAPGIRASMCRVSGTSVVCGETAVYRDVTRPPLVAAPAPDGDPSTQIVSPNVLRVDPPLPIVAAPAAATFGLVVPPSVVATDEPSRSVSGDGTGAVIRANFASELSIDELWQAFVTANAGRARALRRTVTGTGPDRYIMSEWQSGPQVEVDLRLYANPAGGSTVYMGTAVSCAPGQPGEAACR